MTNNNIETSNAPLNAIEQLKNDTNLILDSFTVGSGKTNDQTLGFKVSDKMSLAGLELRLQNHTLIFKAEAHKNAYITASLYRVLKDLSSEQVAKLFEHLSKGYISLNHKDNDTIQSADYSGLFQSIGVVSINRVSIKSKLYTLLFDTTKNNIYYLVSEGFIIHSPVLDDTYQVIGFNVEYPKATGEK